MSPVTTAVLVTIAGYALGGVSLSYRVVRRHLGADVRELGSGNPGATNVLGLLGVLPALVVLAVDVGKGVVAVVGARSAGVGPQVLGAVAAAVVLGHIFPMLHQFRGGKGVATAFGAFGAITPVAAGLALALFLTIVLVTRYVALASTSAALSLPLAMPLSAGLGLAPPTTPFVIVSAALVALLIVIRHRDNFRRIAVGTEQRLGIRRGGDQA